MSRTLKLVILYDARRNTYTVYDHNLSAEDALTRVADLKGKLLSALSIDQRARHRTTDPQRCKTCRHEVRRSSGLQPKPRFERRRDT